MELAAAVVPLSLVMVAVPYSLCLYYHTGCTNILVVHVVLYSRCMEFHSTTILLVHPHPHFHRLLQDVGLTCSAAALLAALEQLHHPAVQTHTPPPNTPTATAHAAWVRCMSDTALLEHAARNLQADVDAGEGRMACSLRCSGLLKLLQSTGDDVSLWLVIVNAATRSWLLEELQHHPACGGGAAGGGGEGVWKVEMAVDGSLLSPEVLREMHDVGGEKGGLKRVLLVTPQQLQRAALDALPPCKAMRYVWF